MGKTVMPINMAINMLEKVMPCRFDEENQEDTYKETSMLASVTPDQISGLDKYKINAKTLIVNAAVNELNYRVIRQYIDDIKAFGEQTCKDINCVFTESLSYNIDHAIYVLETLHIDNDIKPVIFMTSDKCKEIINDPNFKPNDTTHKSAPAGDVMLFGTYKDADIYQVLRLHDSFTIVCYNKDYILHYGCDSLICEETTDPALNTAYELKFKSIFINENATHNYLTIN